MLRTILIFLGTVGLIFGGGSAGAGATGTFRIGDWVGGAYRHNHNSEFDHCAAQSTNANGITIIYSLDRSYVWRLALFKPNWNFTRGASFPIIFRLNKRESFRPRAYALTNNLVRIDFVNSLEVFTELSRSFQLNIIAGGFQSHFDLAYGANVMVKLTKCVIRNEAHSRDLKALRSIWRTPYGSPTIIRGGSAAAEFAATIVKLSAVRGARLARKDEIPANINADVFWKIGPVLFGASILTSEETLRLHDLPSLIVGSNFQKCHKGDFFAAATFQRSDLLKGSNGLRVARIYTFCQIPGTRTTIFYLATPRKTGGVYLLATIGRGSEFAPTIERAAKRFNDDIQSVLNEALK